LKYSLPNLTPTVKLTQFCRGIADHIAISFPITLAPVRQHQVTTITASKMISTEHQNGQEGKTATAEGMLDRVRVVCS
jgi:hypothetical protein